MPLLPILCVCENVEYVPSLQVNSPNVWSELLSSRASFQLEDEVLDTSEP